MSRDAAAAPHVHDASPAGAGAHGHGHHHHHEHGHERDGCPACGETALARAETVCEARGVKLTPMRSQVLTLLAESARPLGAYDLIDRVAGEDGKRPAPITIYRALDFLLEQGLVHRIESRNAFLACDHTHDPQEVVVFLLCERCGTAREASDPALARAVAGLAGKAGFAPRGQVIEIAGLCADCRGTDD